MAARKTPSAGRKGHDKLWSDAIRLAAFEKFGRGGKKALRVAAEKLVAMACEGDVNALREMGNRLEGVPTQRIEHAGALEVSYVARLPAPSATSEEWLSQNSPTIQ